MQTTMEAMAQRLIRMETRMVKLMIYEGVNDWRAYQNERQQQAQQEQNNQQEN